MKRPNLDIRDVFFIVGLALFSTGIGILSIPAMLIAVGAIGMAIALMGAKGKK